MLLAAGRRRHHTVDHVVQRAQISQGNTEAGFYAIMLKAVLLAKEHPYGESKAGSSR